MSRARRSGREAKAHAPPHTRRLHMTATANDQKTGRVVAGEELFESLAHFVVIHNGQSSERAERIADQAVAFLVTAATATVPMVPSDDVDFGLHALILHTKEYAE